MVIPVDRDGRVVDNSTSQRINDKNEPNTRKGGGRDDRNESPKVLLITSF